VPDTGVVKIYVPQAGVVVEEHVFEGQHVDRNDVLFVVSSERQTAAGAAQAAISEQAVTQRNSLREELAKNERLLALERTALENKIVDLQEEMSQLTRLIESQRSRVELARHSLERYEQLKAGGFVTHEQLLQKQADVLEQGSRLESLERDHISTRRNLGEARSQLAALPLKYENQTAELRRDIAATEQSLMESEVRRRFLVVTTEAGIISAITAHRGQWVDGTTALASIVPDGAKLEAELYAPSRAIGFVKPGDAVYLRYQAFPYQKFGQQRGTIADVAKTPLTSAELTRTNVFETGTASGGEPLYRISVELASQSIKIHLTRQTLRTGMLLDADIVQERRRLYEWALEPLYSLSKRR